jgi:hypothetical protein
MTIFYFTANLPTCCDSHAISDFHAAVSRAMFSAALAKLADGR